nr:MAG TPA: tail protein [Caudoviricetes sp.]
MENLILYAPNGVEIPLVSYANNSIPTEAKCTMEWQGDESISLRIESAMPIEIPLYSYVDYKGVRFRMTRPAEMKKEYDTLEYGIELESARYELGRVLYDTSVDPTQAALSKVYSGGSFGNLYHFADILVANIKRALGVTWKIEGAAKDDKGGQLLSFERSENCLSALHKIAQAFHVFFFTSEDVNSGVRTIRFVSECEYNPQPREEWNIGSELFSVDRKYMGSDNVITRLWAFGSQEGAERAGDRLTLPSKDMTNSYIEDSEKVRLYGLSEGVYIDEEAKPTYTGDVTKETDDPYTFQSASWLMFSKLQDGETAKVHFETGGLQGMEFSVKRVKDGKITINPIVDKDLKLEYPSKDSSSPYRIKAGDTFRCLGVEYPLWITLSARDRLQASATLHYNEVSSPKMEYSLVLRDGFETSVKVGDVVTIVDDSIPQGGRANLIVQQIDVDIIARECSIQVSNFRRKRRIEEIYKGWKERLNGILDYLNLKGYQAESFAWFKGLEEHSSLLDRQVDLKEDKSNAKTKYEQLDSEIHKRVPREFFDRKIAEYVPTSEFLNRINGLVPLKDFTDLQTIVNNEISSWTLESVPSIINKDIQAATIRSYNAEPYNSWGKVGTDRNLDSHVGDTWLVNKAGIPENGKVYRFVKGSNPNTYRWVQLADSPALDALNKIASLSQSLSDTKEYFNTNLGARVFDEFNARKEELKGENGAGVRPNLFEFASLDKNSREQGGLRIDEVTAGKRLSAGTFNIHGGRDLTRVATGVAVQLDLIIYRTARENGEFKRHLTLRTMRPPNDVIYYVSSKTYPEEPGTYHIELICPISEEQSKNPKELYIHGWLLDWGRGFMDCELRNVKVEYLYEGEPQRCSAYIPNTSDMIPLLPKIENGEWLLPDQLTRKYLSTGIRAKGEDGNPGKDAPPIRPNLLRGFMGQVVNIKAKENDNYNYRLIIDKKWIEDNKAYVASADFELIEGEKQAEVTLLFRLNGVPNMYSHTPLNGKSKGRVSIYIPAGVYNTDGVFGYAGRAGKTKGVAARYSNIKLEEVQDGEPKEASAYLPHTDDLKVPLSSVVKDLKEQGISSEVKELLKADNSFVLATKGEAGHSPAPEEVLGTSRFAELLGSEVTQQVKPVKDNLDTANTNISNLQKVALTPQQRTDLGYLTYSLQLLKSGGNGTLEGLSLQRYIALSGDKQTVSAYLASNALPAVLKAGITGFGTPNEREQVEITHTGMGHLGNLYFSGSQIDFRTSRDDDPYLSIGAEENQFIDDFLGTARLDDTPVSVGTVTLTASTASNERTVDVANDGPRLTVSIGDVNVATHRGATTRLSLDGEVLAEWRGGISISGGGSVGGIVIEPQYSEKPYIASNLSYERVVKAGRHTLRIEIIKPTSGATATIRGLRVRRRYDTGAQQSALTKSGLRLFGSPDRYLDVDYREEYEDYIPSMGMSILARNHYTVRIKGGAKVDKLAVDELDMPGVPLCGASFNANGTQIKAFGKYVNRQGQDVAQAVYDYGMTAFKVYHSIGHTNYIPIVQVSGWDSNDINWSLTPRVYDVNPDYFVVRILSNNDNPQRKAISYVAYKTE